MFTKVQLKLIYSLLCNELYSSEERLTLTLTDDLKEVFIAHGNLLKETIKLTQQKIQEIPK